MAPARTIAERRVWPHDVERAGRVTCRFGRHRGRSLAWILTHDREYFRWLATKAILTERMAWAMEVLWRAHGRSLGPREANA